MRIEIAGPINIKEGISQKTQKPYRIASQKAFVHLEGQTYPSETQINVSEEDHPKGYPTGIYEIDIDASVSVGRYGIDFRDIVLGKKIAEAKAA